jgi:hemoglobin
MFRRLTPWLLLALAGCMEGQKPTPLTRTATPPSEVKGNVPPPPPHTVQGKKSLYERLGGHTAIVSVVDDLVDFVVADDKIRPEHKKHFKEGDVAGLKQKLVNQIGEATGGPERYTGKNMKDAHRGLGITDADFDALVSDLVKAMDKNKVPAKEQEELKAKLAPMRGDIVESKD